MPAPIRRAIAVLAAPVIALLMLLGAGAALGESSTTLFGQTVPPVGTTVENVEVIPGLLTAQSLTVTADASGVVSAEAELLVGSDQTPLAAALTYTDQQNWSFHISANAAGAGYHTASGTQVNLNHISGTVGMEGGAESVHLKLQGLTVGSYTGDIALLLTPDGFEGTVHVPSLDLSGSHFQDVNLHVSTISPKAEISGTMTSNVGTFKAHVLAEGPLADDQHQVCVTKGSWGCIHWLYSQPKKARYHTELTVSGADLGFAKPGSTFELKGVSFHTSYTGHTYTCAQWHAAMNAQMLLRGVDVDFKNLEIGVACSKLEKFSFVFSVAHTDPVTQIVTTAEMGVAWRGVAGSSESFTGHQSGAKILGDVATFDYTQGLFGYADLSKSRRFREGWKNWEGKTKHFDVNIAIGMKFGFAVYQQAGGSTWHTMLGMGGYLHASRVKGEIGCLFKVAPSLDANCGVGFSVDPAWAGKYDRYWSV